SSTTSSTCPLPPGYPDVRIVRPPWAASGTGRPTGSDRRSGRRVRLGASLDVGTCREGRIEHDEGRPRGQAGSRRLPAGRMFDGIPLVLGKLCILGQFG